MMQAFPTDENRHPIGLRWQASTAASPPPGEQARWGPTPDGTAPILAGPPQDGGGLASQAVVVGPKATVPLVAPSRLAPPGATVIEQEHKTSFRSNHTKRHHVVASITRPPDEKVLAAQGQSDVPLGLGPYRGRASQLIKTAFALARRSQKLIGVRFIEPARLLVEQAYPRRDVLGCSRKEKNGRKKPR